VAVSHAIFSLFCPLYLQSAPALLRALSLTHLPNMANLSNGGHDSHGCSDSVTSQSQSGGSPTRTSSALKPPLTYVESISQPYNHHQASAGRYETYAGRGEEDAVAQAVELSLAQQTASCSSPFSAHLKIIRYTNMIAPISSHTRLPLVPASSHQIRPRRNLLLTIFPTPSMPRQSNWRAVQKRNMPPTLRSWPGT